MSDLRDATKKLNRRSVAILLLIVGGSILLRAPFFSVPMITDEGGYAYVAKFWSSDYEVYRDIPFDRPQAIFLIYQLAFTLIGTDTTAIRLFAAVYNGFTVAMMFFLCRRVLSMREAWVGATLLAIFSASPRIEGFTANAETFMLLPLVISAYLTWKRQWFWAGVTGAIAVLLKPSGASALGLTLTWAVVSRETLRAWLRVGLGATLALLPSVLHGVWVGWEYFWASIYERRLILYNPDTVGLGVQLDALVRGLNVTASSWVFLAVASLRGAKRPGRERSFGLVWLGFSLAGVAMGGWWREHYFIQLVPPLVFLGAMGLTRLLSAPRRNDWLLALSIALALFIVRDVALAFQSPKAISWKLYHRAGYLLSDQISEHVKAVTGEEDTIYVAFAEAELYYLSERRAAVPQLYFLHAEHSEKVFASVIEAIEKRQPALILLVQPPPAKQMTHEDFLDIVRRGYTEDRVFAVSEDINAITLFRRKD